MKHIPSEDGLHTLNTPQPNGKEYSGQLRRDPRLHTEGRAAVQDTRVPKTSLESVQSAAKYELLLALPRSLKVPLRCSVAARLGSLALHLPVLRVGAGRYVEVALVRLGATRAEAQVVARAR